MSDHGGRSGLADGTRMLLTGNHAVSYGAMLSRPELVPIYPITPQTPIAEKITELQLSGRVRRGHHDRGVGALGHVGVHHGVV